MPKTKKESEFLQPAPPDYKWPRCPEADQFIEESIRTFLFHHSFAQRLSARLKTETSTLFSVWVDHLILPLRRYKSETLRNLGFIEDKQARSPAGTTLFYHPYADLPRLLLSSRATDVGCAIIVEDIWRFQLAHGVAGPIEGAPYSSYRSLNVSEGKTEFYVVERRGSQNCVPNRKDQGLSYIACFEEWTGRKRHFESDVQGIKATLQLAKQIVKKVGTGPAATLFLEGERHYWEKRNHAAQVQKARQDDLGLGWANHDHHTFRSSRALFPMLIQILLTFGFKKRERYYAGKEAGWGAQIMEQPEAGVIIFADVDLAPEDVAVDFSRIALPNLQKPGTVGLWCALHGDSILQAGMHHLEAKFDFDQLKSDLASRQVDTMPPFSNFPFLRQAFTKAELWTVPEKRLDALRASGALSEEAYQQIKTKGAVGSHLENLQRHEGFKGFNQRGVSEIISAVNPEKLAVAKQSEQGAA